MTFEVRDIPARQGRAAALRDLPQDKALFFPAEGRYEGRMAALQSRLWTDAKEAMKRYGEISGRRWHTLQSFKDGGVYIWWEGVT
jgi:DNA-binding FadR family transcriptional regulator